MNALRFAVLGHPIAHSLSPAMHRAAFEQLGLPHTYEAIDVPDLAALAAWVERLREGELAGANVTLPYKVAVLDLVDAIDASANAIGAANTLVCSEGRVVAHNTDIAGLADDLREAGVEAERAVVLGAGGAGLAAIAAARELGVREIGVTSRSWTSAEAIAASASATKITRLGAQPLPFPAAEGPSGFADFAAEAGLLLQATPAGTKGAASGELVAAIVPWERIDPSALAYDLVYNPAETPFLLRARRAGLRARGGLGMLARQGARALASWLNVNPDVAAMQRAAERALCEVST